MTDPKRRLIGKWATVFTREKVYQTDEGIETETNEHYEVTQRRVLFDDVMLVTYHRAYGKLYLTLSGGFSFGFLLLIVFLSTLGEPGVVGAIVVGLITLPFLIAFLVRAIFGVDIVTVFGRRSKAVIHFRLRKRRAREVYGQICATVRAAHRRLEEANAAAPAPSAMPADDLPPLPPEAGAG